MNEKEMAIEKTDNPTIVPTMRGIIRPIVKVDEALEAWKEYQALKEKLASDGDFVKIQDKMHPTKQYANKISKFFGLSVQIVKADKEIDGDGFTWHIWTRATAPNGQYRESDGHCSSKERKFSHLEHDVYATAVTRSKNRAILELAGFGEVSAEEIVDENGKRESAPAPKVNITLTSLDGKKMALDFAGALKWFAAAKKRTGDENYYELLGSIGCEHANEIPAAKMPEVFGLLVEMIKQAKK
jgi:hypothetical protein